MAPLLPSRGHHQAGFRLLRVLGPPGGPRSETAIAGAPNMKIPSKKSGVDFRLKRNEIFTEIREKRNGRRN